MPFEGREVEGSLKYRRERVPKAGGRREETITEPIIFLHWRVPHREYTDDVV